MGEFLSMSILYFLYKWRRLLNKIEFMYMLALRSWKYSDCFTYSIKKFSEQQIFSIDWNLKYLCLMYVYSRTCHHQTVCRISLNSWYEKAFLTSFFVQISTPIQISGPPQNHCASLCLCLFPLFQLRCLININIIPLSIYIFFSLS